MAHQVSGEIDDAAGDAAAVHQFAREKEEQDRQQHRAVDPADEHLRDHLERNARTSDKHCCRRRCQNGKHQRNADQGQESQSADQDGNGHRVSSATCRRSMTGSSRVTVGPGIDRSRRVDRLSIPHLDRARDGDQGPERTPDSDGQKQQPGRKWQT